MPFQKLSSIASTTSAAGSRRRPSGTIGVEATRARQSARFATGGRGGVTPPLPLTTNADMGPTQVRDHCPVDETGRQLLGAAMQRLRPGDEPPARGRTTGC